MNRHHPLEVFNRGIPDHQKRFGPLRTAGHVRRGFLVGAAGHCLEVISLFRGLHWAHRRWAGDWKLYGKETGLSFACVVLLLLQVLVVVS